MPFSIHSFRRFPVQCPVTYHARPFLQLPLAYVLGFGVLITLLVLNSGPAYAEWVMIGNSESLGGYTIYVNPDTLRRKGDHQVKVWALTDFTTLQTVAGHSFLSSMEQIEFDCAEELERELAVTWFSAHMGNGNGVWHNSDKTEWRSAAPGSAGEGVWKFACGCATAPCRIPPLT